MASGNSTVDMSFSSRSFLLSIILDAIGIGLCIIAICQTSILILLIFIRRRFIKLKERILFLLNFNMYANVLVFSLFTLDMFISMIRGHLNPNAPELHNNTMWCRLKIYLSTIALISALYSNTLQALHRLFRIVYYPRPFLYHNISLYITGIIIQVLLSATLQLPVLLLGDYNYEDYHCQVYLINWRGILRGASLVWLPPVVFTITVYAYTMRYIRVNAPTFTLQQKRRVDRDFTVIRRVLWLVIFIILFGTPACSTTIVYYVFGYVGWWANHLTWLTFILSFNGMTIVHTYYAPHLRALWSGTRNRMASTAAGILLINR